MYLRAIVSTIGIFALMIAGFFFLPPGYKETPLTNVAITLIDVIGDGNTIKAGQVSLPCLATRDDTIADQFQMLKEKIIQNPGGTQYLNGIYVTLAANGRRPVFQIRYPGPAYCAPFVEAYKACFENAAKSEDPNVMVGAAGLCIQQAAGTLKVTEDWSGMIEEYSKKQTK